jgi:hypothetical protein
VSNISSNWTLVILSCFSLTDSEINIWKETFLHTASLQCLWTGRREADLPKQVSGLTRPKLACLGKEMPDLCQGVWKSDTQAISSLWHVTLGFESCQRSFLFSLTVPNIAAPPHLFPQCVLQSHSPLSPKCGSKDSAFECGTGRDYHFCALLKWTGWVAWDKPGTTVTEAVEMRKTGTPVVGRMTSRQAGAIGHFTFALCSALSGIWTSLSPGVPVLSKN